MKCRFDYLIIFKNFNAFVKTQHSTTIKTFRFDLGVNTFLMILPFYLPLMELYTRPLALILLNKMVLLKGNISCKIILIICLCSKCFLGQATLTSTHILNQNHDFTTLSPFEKLYIHAPIFSCIWM